MSYGAVRVWALAVHSASDVARMASHDQVFVSVASLSRPGVELPAAGHAQLAPVRAAVMVDVVESEEFDVALAAATTADVALTVVAQRPVAIFAKPRDALLVVAVPAP